MWRVLSVHLGLKKIQAMTSINFTSATDPKNATSVYKGSSSFTRCVWEVSLGNVVSRNLPPLAAVRSADSKRPWPQDLCVGDFWETQERRSIATFTTAIDVDRFMLVTTVLPQSNAELFPFPGSFASYRSARRR